MSQEVLRAALKAVDEEGYRKTINWHHVTLCSRERHKLVFFQWDRRLGWDPPPPSEMTRVSDAVPVGAKRWRRSVTAGTTLGGRGVVATTWCRYACTTTASDRVPLTELPLVALKASSNSLMRPSSVWASWSCAPAIFALCSSIFNRCRCSACSRCTAAS